MFDPFGTNGRRLSSLNVLAQHWLTPTYARADNIDRLLPAGRTWVASTAR